MFLQRISTHNEKGAKLSKTYMLPDQCGMSYTAPSRPNEESRTPHGLVRGQIYLIRQIGPHFGFRGIIKESLISTYPRKKGCTGPGYPEESVDFIVIWYIQQKQWPFTFACDDNHHLLPPPSTLVATTNHLDTANAHMPTTWPANYPQRRSSKLDVESSVLARPIPVFVQTAPKGTKSFTFKGYFVIKSVTYHEPYSPQLANVLRLEYPGMTAKYRSDLIRKHWASVELAEIQQEEPKPAQLRVGTSSTPYYPLQPMSIWKEPHDRGEESVQSYGYLKPLAMSKISLENGEGNAEPQEERPSVSRAAQVESGRTRWVSDQASDSRAINAVKSKHIQTSPGGIGGLYEQRYGEELAKNPKIGGWAAPKRILN